MYRLDEPHIKTLITRTIHEINKYHLEKWHSWPSYAYNIRVTPAKKYLRTKYHANIHRSTIYVLNKRKINQYSKVSKTIPIVSLYIWSRLSFVIILTLPTWPLLWHKITLVPDVYTGVQSQKAVSAWFTSEQILPFGCARQHRDRQDISHPVTSRVTVRGQSPPRHGGIFLSTRGCGLTAHGNRCMPCV